MTYITKEYDFHTALCKVCPDIDIQSTSHIANNATLVETNYGSFVCETIEDKTGDVWMKVYSVVE